MNTTFKYNASAKYSTKGLKCGYNSDNFSLWNIYLDEKGTSVKIQLPNIFRDHHIVAKQRLVMNGPYLLPFEENFIIAMVNTSLN